MSTPPGLDALLRALNVKVEVTRNTQKVIIDPKSIKICETYPVERGYFRARYVFYHFDGKGVTVTIVRLGMTGNPDAKMWYFPLVPATEPEVSPLPEGRGAGIQ